MTTGTGFLLIVAGLLLMYAVVTGKLAIIENAFYQLFNITPDSSSNSQQQTDQQTQSNSPSMGTQIGPITLPNIFIPDYGFKLP